MDGTANHRTPVWSAVLRRGSGDVMGQCLCSWMKGQETSTIWESDPRFSGRRFQQGKKTYLWGGLYKNDSQIDDFRIVRCEKDPEGKGYIEVSVRSGKEWSDDI